MSLSRQQMHDLLINRSPEYRDKHERQLEEDKIKFTAHVRAVAIESTELHSDSGSRRRLMHEIFKRHILI